MSETTNATASQNDKTDEVKALSAEEKKVIFDSIPDTFKPAITELNNEIAEHNKNVAAIQSAEKKDPGLIKAEIFEQNDDPDIKKLRTQELKLIEAIEKLRKQGYELIEKKGLVPEELTEEKVAALKTEVTESGKSLKGKVEALVMMENMMPALKGKLSVLLDEIKTRRGISSAAKSSSQEGTKRLRFSRITINDVTQDEKGNTVYKEVDGEQKYTFTFASQYLKKQHRGINWSPKDLTDAYMASVPDADNLPESHTFEMPFTFKNANGTEETVIYKIKAER